MTWRLVGVVLGMTSTMSSPAAAQLPTERPGADEILAGIASPSGTTWDIYADFEGCPLEDPVGSEVLERLSEVRLSPTVRASLLAVWTDEFQICGHGPLNRWYVDSLVRSAMEGPGAALALTVLEHPFERRLLRWANESLGLYGAGDWSRGDIATALIGRVEQPGSQARFLNIVAQHSFPSDWVASWHAGFLRSGTSDYLDRLSEIVTEAPEETRHGAVGTTLTALSLGTLEWDHPGLVRFVDVLEPFDPVRFETLDRYMTYFGLQATIDVVEEAMTSGILASADGAAVREGLDAAWESARERRSDAVPHLARSLETVATIEAAGRISAEQAARIRHVFSRAAGLAGR